MKEKDRAQMITGKNKNKFIVKHMRTDSFVQDIHTVSVYFKFAFI